MKDTVRTIYDELEEIRAVSEDGEIHPEEVVEWARRHHNSKLHAEFDWDNNEAAEKWRVQQARQIIVKVHVEVRDNESIRAFVSVSSAAASTNGGYARTQDLMATAEGRAEIGLTVLNRVEGHLRSYPLREFSLLLKAVDKQKQAFMRRLPAPVQQKKIAS